MSSIQRYQKRISGPLMDRMALCARCTNDIHLDVQRMPYQKLTAIEGGVKSAVIRDRIEAARERQQARFTKLGKPGLLANGDMGPAEVQAFCKLDDGRGCSGWSNLMRAAVKQMDLSARAYHRVLKLSRTIADLAGEENIRSQHLAEALKYRPRGIG